MDVGKRVWKSTFFAALAGFIWVLFFLPDFKELVLVLLIAFLLEYFVFSRI